MIRHHEGTKRFVMAIQLTPEQEQRIQAVVSAGAYASAEEALDAALAAVETAAAHDFEGTQEELEGLEGLLVEGLASQELSEGEFWDSVDHETNAMLAAHKPDPRS
jgi:Arc/MetJ-type ribon-helix-helix transcriptional regulator